jgi:murein DD-endopeptidase MepM/ murein hydrolase activator NlpD
MARRKTKGRTIKLIFPLAMVGLLYAAVAAFRAGPAPEITITPDLPAIGMHTEVTVEVRQESRGLSAVRVEFVQGDRVEMLEARSYQPLNPWHMWGEITESDTMTLVVGKETIKNLKEGQATVRVTADRAPSLLRSPDPVMVDLTLEVRLRPPLLQVTSEHTYVAQGGSEVVVYKVGASSVRDGVLAGEQFFPGYALPGGAEDERFCLFGVPFDLDDHNQVRLVARDDINNEARIPFIDRFFAKPFKQDTIRISDGFLERVVPAIMDQSPELDDQGDLLSNYLLINRDLRRQNAATLTEMSATSTQAFLWDSRFMQMRNAQVMSDFADRRTYVYKGQDVDRQDHLGYDLASTRQAAIQAANDGVVLLARYFGIYGNAVAIDHGFGLISMYGHLSEIAVEEGATIKRGETVGRSGQTGLAGGDHLHFSMLLHGMPVNPAEWWDDHWIHDRLELKLGDALPFEP